MYIIFIFIIDKNIDRFQGKKNYGLDILPTKLGIIIRVFLKKKRIKV